MWTKLIIDSHADCSRIAINAVGSSGKVSLFAVRWQHRDDKSMWFASSTLVKFRWFDIHKHGIIIRLRTQIQTLSKRLRHGALAFTSSPRLTFNFHPRTIDCMLIRVRSYSSTVWLTQKISSPFERISHVEFCEIGRLCSAIHLVPDIGRYTQQSNRISIDNSTWKKRLFQFLNHSRFSPVTDRGTGCWLFFVMNATTESILFGIEKLISVWMM